MKTNICYEEKNKKKQQTECAAAKGLISVVLHYFRHLFPVWPLFKIIQHKHENKIPICRLTESFMTRIKLLTIKHNSQLYLNNCVLLNGAK